MNDRLKLAMALSLASLFGLAACRQQDTGQSAEQSTAQATEQAAEPATAPAPEAAPVLGSGIDMSGFDTSVRP